MSGADRVGSDLDADPIKRFLAEFERASESEPFDAARCALATADGNGIPSVRFVLLKEASERGFVFYTNYDSAKAADIAANPQAALAFHWHTTGVQIRVAGGVERVSSQESDAYFATRDRGSQIGARASQQSARLDSRDLLDERVAQLEREFEGRDVTRPDFWGGYRITPRRIEFWYNRDNRLHDRLAYTLLQPGWECVRLAP